MAIVPVIMSGGAGTRLWPLSTAARPKQFLQLGGERTLIQDTALRFAHAPAELQCLAPVVVGGAAHAALILAELRAVGVEPAEVILEPEGRNTAATAVLAAAAVQRLHPGALALLVPADHRIADGAGFCAVVAKAAAVARERICTFGITPSRPETGYGYIQAGAALADGVSSIVAFKEKPSRAVAEDYIASGEYFWNAGIFLFAPDVMLQEFAAAETIRDIVLGAYAKARREGVCTYLGSEFLAAPSLPVDVAVMERTALGAVAPCSIGWADIGSWQEVHALTAQDVLGNAIEGPVALRDVRDCLVVGDGVTVAAAGVEGLVIIATREAVLVLPKDRAQEVKQLVEAVRQLRP